jgi:DNA-binding response OmpR family regulator
MALQIQVPSFITEGQQAISTNGTTEKDYMTNGSIFIVDDDPDLLDLFGMVLKRLPYNIVKLPGGQEALDLIKVELPALVILDVAMPEVTGIDVLQTIRATPEYAGIKIILLTAVPNVLMRDNVSLANLVLSKPITPTELEARVRNILGI